MRTPAAIDERTIMQQRFSTVFRFDQRDNGGPDLAVKLFPLGTWKHQRRHRQFAIAESINQLCAQARGIRVPELLAVGWLREQGRVRSCVMCMRFVDRRTISQHLEICDDLNLRRQLIWRAIPSFIKLYRTGCNHVDFGPHAILIGEDDPTNDVLIDFEGATFLPRPSPTVLAAQAGNYGWALSTRTARASTELVQQWFEELLDQCELTGREDLWKIWSRYLVARPSVRERMRRR
jgi:hypothetical protein